MNNQGSKRKISDYFVSNDEKLKIKSSKEEIISEESNIKPMDNYLLYKKQFLENPHLIYEKILKEVKLEQKQVLVFGKTFDEPRLTAVYGDENICDLTYSYSKSTRKLNPMTPTLIEIQKTIEEFTKIHFDFVLLNFYRNGNDKVSWHSDDEKTMDCSNIISISLGTQRKFRLRDKIEKKVVWEESLETGSLLWMKKDCQNIYQHEIPLEKRISTSRLSLTFRKFNEKTLSTLKK